MKVLYDHQIFDIHKFGGISRYFSELAKLNPDSRISVRYSDNIYLKDKYFNSLNIKDKKNNFSLFLPNLNFKGKRTIYNIYYKIKKKDNKIISIKEIKKNDFDIFHPTYYYTYFLNYLQNKTFILTVYDLIHEIYPECFQDSNETIKNKKELINKANKIIAISENTKKDILKYYPEIDENKIKVIYLGTSFQKLNDNMIKENYILYTGSRATYKNFSFFVRALAPLLTNYDLRLVCTGHPFTQEEKILLDNLHISTRTTSIFVSDTELSNIYSKALAFVFPSLYEGFGIPVLESFASRCPAILSNSSSLNEIGGDAALYFDPNSIDDMRNQIERVIVSSSLQKELIIKGSERLKLFSWKKCTEETMELYKNLI